MPKQKEEKDPSVARHFRVRKSEWERIESDAARQNMSASEFIRSRVLEVQKTRARRHVAASVHNPSLLLSGIQKSSQVLKEIYRQILSNGGVVPDKLNGALQDYRDAVAEIMEIISKG